MDFLTRCATDCASASFGNCLRRRNPSAQRTGKASGTPRSTKCWDHPPSRPPRCPPTSPRCHFATGHYGNFRRQSRRLSAAIDTTLYGTTRYELPIRLVLNYSPVRAVCVTERSSLMHTPDETSQMIRANTRFRSEATKPLDRRQVHPAGPHRGRRMSRLTSRIAQCLETGDPFVRAEGDRSLGYRLAKRLLDFVVRWRC